MVVEREFDERENEVKIEVALRKCLVGGKSGRMENGYVRLEGKMEGETNEWMENPFKTISP